MELLHSLLSKLEPSKGGTHELFEVADEHELLVQTLQSLLYNSLSVATALGSLRLLEWKDSLI